MRPFLRGNDNQESHSFSGEHQGFTPWMDLIILRTRYSVSSYTVEDPMHLLASTYSAMLPFFGRKDLKRFRLLSFPVLPYHKALYHFFDDLSRVYDIIVISLLLPCIKHSSSRSRGRRTISRDQNHLSFFRLC